MGTYQQRKMITNKIINIIMENAISNRFLIVLVYEVSHYFSRFYFPS